MPILGSCPREELVAELQNVQLICLPKVSEKRTYSGDLLILPMYYQGITRAPRRTFKTISCNKKTFRLAARRTISGWAMSPMAVLPLVTVAYEGHEELADDGLAPTSADVI